MAARGKRDRVVTYRDELRSHFERLNRAWIERYFRLEAPDLEVFRDPRRPSSRRADRSSSWWMMPACKAPAPFCPIGRAPSSWPRWRSRDEARGRGYGDLLMEAAIAFARRAGAERLMLLTNSQLAPAIRLYRKHGFVEVPVEHVHGYDRADVQLELALGARAG